MSVQCLKDWITWKGLHAGVGEKCEEEGAAERRCYGLTTNLILLSPALFGEVEEVEVLERINKV